MSVASDTTKTLDYLAISTGIMEQFIRLHFYCFRRHQCYSIFMWPNDTLAPQANFKELEFVILGGMAHKFIISVWLLWQLW